MFFLKSKSLHPMVGSKAMVMDKFFSNNNSLFDFLDKPSMHFFSKHPFQFLSRVNYSYDCFVLAMHFILYLTFFYFYFSFGSGIKTRLSLPFYKFFR